MSYHTTSSSYPIVRAIFSSKKNSLLYPITIIVILFFGAPVQGQLEQRLIINPEIAVNAGEFFNINLPVQYQQRVFTWTDSLVLPATLARVITTSSVQANELVPRTPQMIQQTFLAVQPGFGLVIDSLLGPNNTLASFVVTPILVTAG